MKQITRDFIRLFNEDQNFFECHEIFEAAWKEATDPFEKSFYKLMVRVATAQFKLKKGVLRGVRKHYEAVKPEFLQLPAVIETIDMKRLFQDFSKQVQLLPEVNEIEENTYGQYGVQILMIYHTNM